MHKQTTFHFDRLYKQKHLTTLITPYMTLITHHWGHSRVHHRFSIKRKPRLISRLRSNSSQIADSEVNLGQHNRMPRPPSTTKRQQGAANHRDTRHENGLVGPGRGCRSRRVMAISMGMPSHPKALLQLHLFRQPLPLRTDMRDHLQTIQRIPRCRLML